MGELDILFSIFNDLQVKRKGLPHFPTTQHINIIHCSMFKIFKYTAEFLSQYQEYFTGVVLFTYQTKLYVDLNHKMLCTCSKFRNVPFTSYVLMYIVHKEYVNSASQIKPKFHKMIQTYHFKEINDERRQVGQKLLFCIKILYCSTGVFRFKKIQFSLLKSKSNTVCLIHFESGFTLQFDSLS